VTPAGSTDFLTNPTALAALEAGLVQYFGGALGCSDGTITAYTGASLTSIHQPLLISLSAFNSFNAILNNVVLAYGVAAADAQAIQTLLESLQSQIVYEPTSFCNRYSSALSFTNLQLLTLVVNQTVTALVSNATTLPFFNGVMPSGSTNFLANTQALSSLETQLIQFFGSILGCTDGTIAPYTGDSIYMIHQNMGVSLNAFLTFNALMLGVLQADGVSSSDLTYVNNALLSYQQDIVSVTPYSPSFPAPNSVSTAVIVGVIVAACAAAVLTAAGLVGLAAFFSMSATGDKY